MESVKSLGLSEYEAKVYLALLDESPVSGYRVARNSGVPRSKVYEALGGLVNRGVALVNHGEPVRYAPVSPEEVISRRKRELEGSIENARESLERYVGSADSRGVIWDLTGRGAILERAREMAGRAEQSLLLEVWQEDAPELRESLSEAAGRGVEVSVVAYGDPEYPFARVYLHDSVDEVTRGLGARWLVLSLDLREVVTGVLSMGGESGGVDLSPRARGAHHRAHKARHLRAGDAGHSPGYFGKELRSQPRSVAQTLLEIQRRG